ncbi:dolichyl-phosphate-mannose--protein mannosyltransferase [Vairimorpha necatrix]|uniref:Dolichyl-phosphate-mannose--protein mannosyltransferase n=1 Tax=Vairimorpha necatrix TaxID=6039 RepID=A0AAX4JHT9_9MICR
MKYKTLWIIFFTTFIIRTYKIEKGNFVIWDEAHFGKFSSRYLSRSFYFDVHPPLGKMLTAVGGYLFEQSPDFSFDSGSKYPNNFDYVGMRRFHAFIASLMPVFSYLILKELGYKYNLRILMTMIFIFENGFTSIGRLILLDSHLLTCTSAVIYCLTRLYNRNYKMKDLLLLGISLGLVLSIKWIGCLTTAVVGIFIIYTLYKQISTKEPLNNFILKFFRFASFLIIVPVTIYVLLYYIHFNIVHKSSTDEGHMSSFFQSTLQGNSHIKNRKYIAYGTKITIKNDKYGGGYLHSHDQEYPNYKISQVTSYYHKDNNNNWALQKVSETDKDALFVKNGDKIVLLHMETSKYLIVEDSKAYFSDGLLTGTSKDHLSEDNIFIIEIIKDTNILEDKVKSLTTKFKLRHQNTGNYITSTTQKYPEWGFSQGEIICSEDDSGSIWTVEENISDKISKDVNPQYDEVYKSIFINNFIEHNILQYNVNKSFIQDDDLEPEIITSKPYEWPFLLRGLRMTNWNDDKLKFYMFGNPLLWYSSTVSILVTPVIYFVKYIRYKRGIKKFKKLELEAFEVFICIFGYFMHYIPFFKVSRVLYFHHYYPALFFALLSLCYVLKHMSHKYLQIFIGASIYFYFLFSPLTYGFINPDRIRTLRFIQSWNFLE